jgi:peptidyl-prolyl cis-trans isomerase D
MMKFLRSQSQTVLWLILLVLGGSFLFYGNVGSLLTGGGGHGTTDYGRIDGQDLSVAELYDAVRTTKDALIMSGRGAVLSQAGGRDQVAEEAWRQLLLLHEADKLHIQVSDQELIDYIHSWPLFQKDGVYSPDLYQQQMGMLQNTLHISPDAFEEILRNGLRADAVNKALFSTVRTPAHDVAAQYDKYEGPAQVTVVTFDPKAFAALVQVTPEEIAAEYKAHPENPAYRTQERRKIDYVLFPLTAEQAKLTGKDRETAIEALGEKALNFALALQPNPSAGTNGGAGPLPDFQAVAHTMGLTPVTTDFFTVDTPPTGLPPSPSINQTAFALTRDDPNSKVVEFDGGVAVLHLDDAQPSELRPLDEVKADIEKELRQTKAVQAAQVAAQNAAQALQAAVAKGTDFKTAATALKVDAQTLPEFVPSKVPQTDAHLQTIAYATTELSVGAVSQPIPIESDSTTVVIHLDKRSPADPAGLSRFEAAFRRNEDERLRNVVSDDWANWMAKQPGTHKPPDLEQYGSVE